MTLASGWALRTAACGCRLRVLLELVPKAEVIKPCPEHAPYVAAVDLSGLGLR